MQRTMHSVGALTIDISKNHVTARTLQLLAKLAREAEVPAAIEAMFAGDEVNRTEGEALRYTLHCARKCPTAWRSTCPGVRDVWNVLARMEEFVDAVHAGTH